MQGSETVVAAARTGDERAFRQLVEPHRRELRAHCYRMAGSLHDADDLLQESLLRAWRGIGGFEGRSSVRTWLYKVATSACLDALDCRSARTLPRDLGPPSDPRGPMTMRNEPIWLEPCPDDFIDATIATPEARYDSRQSVALAFLVALQVLPPKQRAALILRDVLGWEASECAELLDTTVASVNSALQRARESMETRGASARIASPVPDDTATAELLARYVGAWENADVSALVSLLRDDATLAMPPFATWLQGAAAIGVSIGAMVFHPEARGAIKLVAMRANGVPAYAAYQRESASAGFHAMAIHVLGVAGGRIVSIDAFLDATLFARFGLPTALED